jgi:energy-coupling factor transporter transmembrane protein EcfT
VALIAASRNWPRLIATSAVAAAVSFGSQSSWRSSWGWWGFMVLGLALTLLFAYAPQRRPAARDA